MTSLSSTPAINQKYWSSLYPDEKDYLINKVFESHSRYILKQQKTDGGGNGGDDNNEEVASEKVMAMKVKVNMMITAVPLKLCRSK